MIWREDAALTTTEDAATQLSNGTDHATVPVVDPSKPSSLLPVARTPSVSGHSSHGLFCSSHLKTSASSLPCLHPFAKLEPKISVDSLPCLQTFAELIDQFRMEGAFIVATESDDIIAVTQNAYFAMIQDLSVDAVSLPSTLMEGTKQEMSLPVPENLINGLLIIAVLVWQHYHLFHLESTG